MIEQTMTRRVAIIRVTHEPGMTLTGAQRLADGLARAEGYRGTRYSHSATVPGSMTTYVFEGVK